MPAQSKQQQKFMGMVHALKKGEMEPSDASPELKKAAQSMSDKDAKDFASTPHKGLPKKVKQEIVNKLKEYANKMVTNTMGGDDYTSSKKGGLRDNDGYDNVDYNKDMPMDESMMSTLDQIRKDSKSVKDFIKNVLLDRNFKDMKSDKDFIKYLGSIYEGKLPNNWMQGRVSDYHTQLRGKKKDYSGGTNFKKDNSGQPDLEDEKSIDEVAPCWNGYKQVGMKNKGGKQVPNCVKESVNESKDEVTPKQLVKIQSDIRKINPKIRVYISKHPVTIGKLQIQLGSSHPSVKGDDREIHQIYKVLKKHTGDWRTGTMFVESVNEASFHALNNPRMKKSLSNLVKDKKVQNPETGKNVALQTALSNNDHPAHDRAVSIKQSLLQRLKGMMKNEYGSVATDNFLLPSQEDKLDGTPKPKKAIGESLDFNEREMVVGIIDILKQVDDKENRKRIALNMIKKFKEEGIEFDYQKFLNHLKEYSMGSYEYNEGKTTQISEAMFVMMRDIAQDILPKDVFQRAVSPQGKEELESIMSDLKNTLNKFFKMHKINKIVK